MSAQDRMQALMTRLLDEVDETYREALRNHDWDEHAILDIVWYKPTIGQRDPSEAPTKEHLIGRIDVHRYEDQAPPPGHYADGDRRYDLTRLTRPLLDRIAEGDVADLLDDEGVL